MASREVEEEFRNAAGRLLQAARAGDAEAVGQLLEHSRRYLLAVANDELADDLRTKASASDQVQDTLTEAVRLFVRFTGCSVEELRLWLVAILHNQLANFRKRYLGTAKRDLARECQLEAPQSVRDPRPSPSAQLQAQEEAALRQALSRLPERTRQVIQWRSWDKLPYAVIGQRLGCSEDAARMTWARAIERLKQEIQSNGPAPP